MITFWLDLWRAQEAAWYASLCDASTFMQWREQPFTQCAGVPNIPGC